MFKLVGLAISAIVALAAAYAFSPRPMPNFPATQINPQRLLVNGVGMAGARVVAVGEQGVILTSDDRGASWANAKLGTSRGSTLTALHFSDAKNGIAVGHDGWILRSADAGSTWEEVAFDTERSEPLLGIGGGAGVAGAPLIAVGSFGRLFLSADQGRTWQRRDLPEAAERHLNAVAAGADGRMLVAGESGLLLRSGDGGASWQKLPEIYNGSFFGVLRLSADEWVVCGMRGRVFRTQDFGRTWERASVPVETALFGGTVSAQGRVVLVGEGGAILVSDDRGANFHVVKAGGRQSLAAVAAATDDTLFVGGESGVRGEKLSAAPSNVATAKN